MDKTTYTLSKRLSHLQASEELQKMRKACKEFETVFNYFLLKNIHQAVAGRNNGANSTGR